MEKITLDLDYCKEGYALLRIKQLKDLGAEEVYCRTSASSDGYHIKAYFKELPSNRYWLRAMLGDDVKRIAYELKNREFKTAPTMWDKKPTEFMDKRAGNWYDF